MIHQIFPNKDATIYEGTSSLNTGLDQILEIEHSVVSGSANSVSRILIQFDLTDVSASISDGTITNPRYYLVMSAMEGTEVQLDYTLDVHPVSESWDMGKGKKFNYPITTDATNWTYRTSTTKWTTGSFSLNTTGSYYLNTGGATWYTLATSSYGTSLTFTAINQNDNIYVTSSNGNVYTFSPSGSTETSSSFTNVNPATASVDITNFSENNVYVISASLSASLTLVDNPYLFDDIPEANVYYFAASGSQTGVGATASIEITNGTEGNVYIVNDGLEYKFIASDTPVPADVPSARVYYFLSSTSSMASTAASLSLEINSVTGLNVTSSYSASYLQLTSSLTSVTGNDYTFTSGSTTIQFVGGIKNDVTSSIKALVDKLNGLNGLGVSVTSSANTLIISASDSGLIGNTYSFISGSTTTNLQGGTTSSIVTSSYTLATDDTTNRLYYFVTGSSLSNSLYNLSEKINNVLTSITTLTSSNTLHATGSGNVTNQQLWGIQSGSTQTTFNTPANVTTLSGSQRFNYASPDTRIDVTNIVNEWIYGNITNHGFVVKRPSSIEAGSQTQGNLKFFSMDSHTIFLPKLQVAWDNQTFTTGSLTALTAEDKVIYVKGLQKNITVNSKTRVRVAGRSKYPTRTFATSSAYLDIKYLPETSYYAIYDTVTDDVIIPFDNSYTKLSCDTNGNYFDLWTTGFLPERYYKIVIKVVSNGTEEYYDDGNYFKVVR